MNSRRLSAVIEEVKAQLLQRGVNVAPARHHAVVAGYPDEEGNSVEVARALARRLPVYWLVSEDPDSLEWLVAENAGAKHRIRCLRKDSAQAYMAYVSARYVFFTHGLYGSPTPPPNKTYVNLWHGDGPKRRKGFSKVQATFVVSGTQFWGQKRAQTFAMRPQDVLVTGNPRIDQFARPVDDRGLRTLGLGPSSHFIIWLPTYRQTEYTGHRIGNPRNWSDSQSLSDTASVRDLLARVAKSASDKGVELLVKPHPLDADDFTESGLKVITRQALRDAHITLYQLLGRARGLLTDYSSVWTDFLALDRPIGFFCPDLDQYVAGRGLNVADYPSLLPGPLLETIADFHDFFELSFGEPQWSMAKRAEATRFLGAETRSGATERLLDAVGVPRLPPR